MPEEVAEIYTDGSCHTQIRTGAWVAIVFTGTEKNILSAIIPGTTHNRMELIAVIKGIQYLLAHKRFITTIRVYSDSQYVIGLPARREKIVSGNYATAKGKELQNVDLVKTFFELLSLITIELVKVKAHQKQGDKLNYNREADMLCRKLLREAVEKDSA